MLRKSSPSSSSSSSLAARCRMPQKPLSRVFVLLTRHLQSVTFALRNIDEERSLCRRLKSWCNRVLDQMEVRKWLRRDQVEVKQSELIGTYRLTMFLYTVSKTKNLLDLICVLVRTTLLLLTKTLEILFPGHFTEFCNSALIC